MDQTSRRNKTNLRSARSLLLLLDDEDQNNNNDNKHDHDNDDDPCLHDRESPTWVPYNKADDLRLWAVQQCIQRIDHSPYPEERNIHSMNRRPNNNHHQTHEKLQCRYEMTDMELFKIIEGYRNITFFGDSVMHHQIMTLFCMLDPTLYHAPEEFPAAKAFRPAYYLYEHYHPTPQQPSPQSQTDFNTGNSNPSTTTTTTTRRMTSIRYVPYAPDWGPMVKKIFYETFQRTIQDFGPQDAIVINGGAGGIHYNKHLNHGKKNKDDDDDDDDVEKQEEEEDDIGMQKINTYAHVISTKAKNASCPIYYMESFHEEWPTSNGNPTPFCTNTNKKSTPTPPNNNDNDNNNNNNNNENNNNNNNNNNSNAKSSSSCSCEMTNPDRLAGHGKFTTQQQQQQQSYDVDNNKSSLPASWRNDIMASKLSLPSSSALSSSSSSSSSTDGNKIRLVPIFRALASQQQLQSRSTHDCSHKSSATMMEMTKQLLRVMKSDSTRHHHHVNGSSALQQ